MRLFFALCSSSTRPSASSNGGTYTPNLPRRPFFNPYQPPTGLCGARPHASTVPSFASLLFVCTAQIHPVAVFLQNCMQVFNAAGVVQQHGFSDRANDDFLAIFHITIHFVFGGVFSFQGFSLVPLLIDIKLSHPFVVRWLWIIRARPKACLEGAFAQKQSHSKHENACALFSNAHALSLLLTSPSPACNSI